MRALIFTLSLLLTGPTWSATQLLFNPIELNGAALSEAPSLDASLILQPGDTALIEILVTGVPNGIRDIEAKVLFDPRRFRVSDPNLPKGLDQFQDIILQSKAAFRPLSDEIDVNVCLFAKRCNDSRFVFDNLRPDEIFSARNGPVPDGSGGAVPGLLEFAHAALGVSKAGQDGALAVLEVALLDLPGTAFATAGPPGLTLDGVIIRDGADVVLQNIQVGSLSIVPLPASAWALLSAGAVLALVRRRRTVKRRG